MNNLNHINKKFGNFAIGLLILVVIFGFSAFTLTSNVFATSSACNPNQSISVAGSNPYVSPSPYFSPNGDGKFDTIDLALDVNYIENENVFPFVIKKVTNINYFLIEVYNEQNQLIRTIRHDSTMLEIFTFDGKDSNGKWLADGKYTFALRLDSCGGISSFYQNNGNIYFGFPSTTVYTKSNLLSEEKVTIQSPLDNSIENLGYFNVSGTAPGQWYVDVCISTTLTDPENCITTATNKTYKYSYYSSVQGYFNIQTNIPDTSTQNYIISASASIPNTGIRTPISNIRKITLDSSDAIKTVVLSSNMDGVNNDDEMQDLVDGKRNVDDLIGLKIKVIVSKNTEAVDINFSPYANVDYSSVKDIKYLNNRVATINSTEDIRKNYSPNRKDLLEGYNYARFYEVQKDAYQNGTTPLGDFGKRCLETTCEWTYSLPYPKRTSGGYYTLEFTGYKGNKTNLIKEEFAINGQLKAKAVLTSMVLGSANINAESKYGVYYTNNLTNKLTFGAASNQIIKLNISNNKNEIVTPDMFIKLNSNGFGTQSITLPSNSTDGQYSILSNKDIIAYFVLERSSPQIENAVPIVYTPTSATTTQVQTTVSTPENNSSKPLYRFWSAQNHGHFYTASAAERDQVIANYKPSEWQYEGVAYNVSDCNDPASTPVYRFWSEQNKHHFYTNSATERDLIVRTYSQNQWKLEGQVFCAYSAPVSDSQPVYRFWSEQNHTHFYTTSEQEKNDTIAKYTAKEWQFEGIAYYVKK